MLGFTCDQQVKTFSKTAFLPPVIRDFFSKKEDGIATVEIIIVLSVVGILSVLAIPQFKPASHKAKQKEASLIVSAMVRGAQGYYGLYAELPENMGQLSKLARFQKCIAENVEIEGALVCKGSIPVSVGNNDPLFYSSSGNYKVEWRTHTTADENRIYQVKANPNGVSFASNGSAVVGCYNATNGISRVLEYSFKASDRGEKSYITCGTIPVSRGEIDDGNPLPRPCEGPDCDGDLRPLPRPCEGPDCEKTGGPKKTKGKSLSSASSSQSGSESGTSSGTSSGPSTTRSGEQSVGPDKLQVSEPGPPEQGLGPRNQVQRRVPQTTSRSNSGSGPGQSSSDSLSGLGLDPSPTPPWIK